MSKRGEAPLPKPPPLLRDALPGEGDKGGEVEKWTYIVYILMNRETIHII
jgi:hypothetical protein